MKQVKKHLPIEKRRGGFTMVELLLVVAILTILFAVAVGGLLQMRKNLRQKELDAKAEIIYAAAQNRMAELRAAGYADAFEPEENDAKGIRKLEDYPEDLDQQTLQLPENQRPVFYWVSSDDRSEEDRTASLLLPSSAVDDELWNANWIIEYNGKTGQVYAVFYSEETLDKFQDESFRQRSRTYNNRLKDGAKVGYYGGDLTLLSNTTTLRPTISIVNDEELTAHFVCRSPDLGNGRHPRLVFDITITDEDGNQEKITLSPTAINNVYSLDLVLDSLETGKQPFYQRFPKLVPGQNIVIQITATVPASEGLSDEEMPDTVPDSRTTNSLFADRKTVTKGSWSNKWQENTAYIRCRRHLQNLNTATSHVTEAINAGQLINDISFRKKAGTTADSFYPFTPIKNTSLRYFYGTDTDSTDGGIFSIKDLYITGASSAGLFEQYQGTIADLVMSNTRIQGAYTAGSLVGTVTGNTTLKNCWAYLSNLSTTKYTDPADVESYINATYAGGLVGSVNTSVNLMVNDSAAATVVSAASGAAGGVAGVVRGSLTLARSYTDCYLKGDYTGGVVGVGPNASLSLNKFYTAGYQTARVWAGGIIPGSVSSGSYTDGYCAVTYPEKNGAPTTVYTTAGSGTASNVFYLETGYENAQSAPRGESLARTTVCTGNNLSSLNLTGFSKGVGTTAYDFLDQGLTQYPYPGLSGMRHYGDWETQVQSFNFVYYERYADGTFGVYGSGLRLSATKEIVGDGYGILLSEMPKNYQFQITYTTRSGGEKTINYTETDNVIRTVLDIQGKPYYLITATPKTNTSYDGREENFQTGDFITDDIARAEREPGSGQLSFYSKIKLTYRNYNDWQNPTQDQYYCFNPYFAKTVVQTANGEAVPDTPNFIYLRTPRHLVALSNLFSEKTTTENGGKHDFPALVSNTSENTYTFLQEREIDLDGDYRWTNFANRAKPASIAPIGGEAYRFNAVYNGQGFEIKNFPIRSESLYTGLFGYVGADGTLENVILSGGYDSTANAYEKISYVNGSRENSLRYSTDELRMGALAGLNAGTVSNCAVSGYEMKLSAYQKSILHLGGLVGVNAGTIRNASADTAKMQLSFDGSYGYIGALAGRNLASASIRQSYAFGIINVTECTDSDVAVSGMIGVNYGAVRDAYCGTAFDVSGSAKTYGFTPRDAGATVDRCYYFDGGTYSYAQKYYSFNVTNSENVGKAISAENLENESLTGFRQVTDSAHTGNHPNTDTDTFEYLSSVTAADGTPVHYGNWPNHEKSMGTVGVFYWEYEEGGHSGYHLSYLGYDGELGKVVSDNTLCNAHDDGGVVKKFGYGYFLKDKVENVNISSVELSYTDSDWNIPEADTEVAAALQKQLPEYQFIAFETGSDKLRLQSAKQNGVWQLTYDGVTYNFSLSPFFANAMSLNNVEDKTEGALWSASATPGITTAYQIRSIAQLQFINWNYAKKNATSQVTATRSYYYSWYSSGYVYEYKEETVGGETVNQCYPYLVNNNDSAKSTIVSLKWMQTHDLNAHSASFTPIGSLYDKAPLNKNESDPLIAYFGSTYDGQDYTIMNVQIMSSAQMVGLFGITSGAKLSNVVLYSNEGNTIGNTTDGENWYSIGGLVGFAAKGGNSNASFTNCTVSGYKILDQRAKGMNITEYSTNGLFNWNLPGWGGACIGGLTGATNMDISECTAVTDITIQIGYNVGWMNVRVGGIVGSSRASLTNCYAGGSIQDKSGLTNDRPAAGTSIWVGGLVGGVIMRNEGDTFNSLVGSTSGAMSVTNCYSYVEVPEAYNGWTNRNTLIKNVQSIASNGEMLDTTGAFGPVDNSDVVITNSYCYVQNALLSSDYKKLGSNYSSWNRTASPNGALCSVTYSNDYTPYLTYGEMSGDYDAEKPNEKNLATFLRNGNKVTTEENGATVNGKYSFPGGDSVLEGKNYPFPTVLTQNEGSVNVHYGRWPKLGLYWTVNDGQIDLFQDRKEVTSQTLEDLSEERPVAAEDPEPLPEGTVTEHITYPDPAEEDTQEDIQENLPKEPQEENPETGIATFEAPAAPAEPPAETPAEGEAGETGTEDAATQAETKTYVAQQVFHLQVVDVAGGTMTAGTPSFTYYTEDMTQEITENPLAEVVSASAYANNISDVTVRANRPGTIVIQASQGGYTADLIVTVTATLKIRLSQASFTVYEGEPATAEVTLTNGKKDAQGNEELVVLPEGQITWKTQTVGGETAAWSVKPKENDSGKYTLTVTGVHAGTLRVPLSATFKATQDSTEISVEAVNFDVTVKPSIVLGLGDGETFNQVSVPKLPVGGETVDGQTPGEGDVQPVKVDEELYLYATRDYAGMENMVIQKVTVNDTVLTLQTAQQAAEPDGQETPAEGQPVVFAEQEETPESMALAQSLPEGEHYVGGDYVLTVGPITKVSDTADYRKLTVTDLDGNEIALQWTLRIEFGRVDGNGQSVLGAYRLTYARPNSLRFYLSNGDTAPKLTEKVAQDGILSEDRLKAINEALRKDAAAQEPGYYLVWEVTGKITENLDVYPQAKGIPYQIAYDGNFTNWTTYLDPIGPSSVTYGEPFDLLRFAKDRSGYTFDGWYTKDENGNLSESAQVVDGYLTLFADGAETRFTPTTPGETKTLYAKWIPNTYSITYNANGGTGDAPAASGTLTYGESEYTVPGAGNLTRSGFRFGGWYYTENGKKIYVPAKNPYIPVKMDDSVELYAEWLLDSMTLTLHKANKETQEVTLEYGEKLPTLTDKGFLGWSLAENGDPITAESLPWDDAVYVSEKLDLYALYGANAASDEEQEDEALPENGEDELLLTTPAEAPESPDPEDAPSTDPDSNPQPDPASDPAPDPESETDADPEAAPESDAEQETGDET